MSEVRKEKPQRPMAVVLASGGLDSCVTTAVAAQDYELAMLHINYGQRTEHREQIAFLDICDYYEVPEKRRWITSIDHLKIIGGSSLTDDRLAVPPADLHNPTIPSSYVPFRNAHLLAIAVSWGEVFGAKKIFIGAVEEDSSGYPDCRKAFFESFNEVIRKGTKPDTDLQILTPVIDLNKTEIVRLGVRLNAPLHLTWSCYQNEDIACGVCDSCALRLRGFRKAGYEDPIPYKQKPLYD